MDIIYAEIRFNDEGTKTNSGGGEGSKAATIPFAACFWYGCFENANIQSRVWSPQNKAEAPE
jgi:hypothetical protein